jgi:hypothetical protein
VAVETFHLARRRAEADRYADLEAGDPHGGKP